MKTTVGLWIDHRKAVIVIVSDGGENAFEIRSHVEKQPGRFAGVRSTTPYEPQRVAADDSRERGFTGHLNRYYSEVIAAIRDAESILLFGPGEAKGELKKRLERDKLGGRIIAMETVDKMTDRQITAKVRECFQNSSSTFTTNQKRTNMKGNEKLLAVLNQLLADELTAISQYMVHSEMCDNWGYDKLHKAIEKQAMDEMHHAEWLIRRVIFLEGTPIVAKLNPLQIGQTVSDMVSNDQKAERAAVHAYNAAIGLARDVADQATADLLGQILKMEEGHTDWAEMQRAQIKQMGVENYLANQTAGSAG